MKQKRWSVKEDEFVKNNFEYMTDEGMAERLGRTTVAVTSRRVALGVLRTTVKKWTKKENDYIKSNYLHKTDEELGEALGRSSNSVREHRLKKLNLRKQNAARSIRHVGSADLDKLILKKSDIVDRLKLLHAERGRHDVTCKCKDCKKINDVEWELVTTNTHIRRAKGIPAGGL